MQDVTAYTQIYWGCKKGVAISCHDPHAIKYPFHCGYVRPILDLRAEKREAFRKGRFCKESITA